MATDDFALLRAAIREIDVASLRKLAATGANLDACDQWGEPLLHAALFDTLHPKGPGEIASRRALIATLIELGADPNQLDSDGASILLGPIFEQNAAMLEFLLEHGVDPNRGGVCDPSESVYDAAEFDYRFEAWMEVAGPPLPDPQPADKADEDAWLRFLDREAQAQGRMRPELLYILRRHGALARSEIAQRLGGDGSERIIWRDGQWHLDEDGVLTG